MSIRTPGELFAPLFGAGIGLAFHLLDLLLEVHSGEPWILRWARSAADHPIRTSLAAVCVVLALAPRSRDAPRGRDGHVVQWPFAQSGPKT